MLHSELSLANARVRLFKAGDFYRLRHESQAIPDRAHCTGNDQDIGASQTSRFDRKVNRIAIKVYLASGRVDSSAAICPVEIFTCRKFSDSFRFASIESSNRL